MFYLVIGHYGLAAHLHRLNIYVSPYWTLCKQLDTVMNGAHLLPTKIQEDTTTQLTRYYWDTRQRMKEIQDPELYQTTITTTTNSEVFFPPLDRY